MRPARGIVAIACVATAISAGVAAVAAPTQEPEFSQLLAQHRQDISTPAGQQDEHQWTEHYQASYGAVLGACIQNSGPPTPFEVIFVIDKDGHVTRGVPKTPSGLVTCVIAAAQRDTFPKPPFAPFHEHLVQSFD
jgi:hypothetical protein